MPNLTNLTPEIIKNYQEEISKNSSTATVKRKSISLNKFFDWAKDEGHITQNPMKPVIENENPYVIVHPTNYRRVGFRTFAVLGITTSLVIIIFLLMQQLPNAIKFIKTPAADIATTDVPKIVKTPQKSTLPLASSQPALTANNSVKGSWNLYASLNLKDTNGNAMIGPQTITFKVYNTPQSGTALYESSQKQVTTDTNGSALISLDSVPQNLFFENNKLFLEPVIGTETVGARIPVSTANISANLNGYFPSEKATEQTIPVIDSTGSLVLASQSPSIKATSGNFLMEGQAVTLKTADGTDGNIEINPDGKGITHFLFEGTGQNFLNAQAPNLTSGSLYYGIVANNATGYDLLRLQNGSGKPVTRFSIDSLGNTYMLGNETVKGNLTVNGITNSGTYNQTSGNFTINQNVNDFASITKNGSALSDVLTLTLDERNKPANPNSNYSTLVLNRFDGSNEAAALKVANGNAIFNGQLQLGRYAGTPSGIGQGSLVYNTSDNQVYVYNGSSWTALGSGSGVAFNNILSGTNTGATMLVGNGASLDFTGTGTINASSINGITSSQIFRNDTSAGSNGQILITSAGVPAWTDLTSQLTAGSDISITGTTNATISNTSTLNSVTTRGATTSNTLTVGNLIDSGLLANKLVFTDGSKQLTSTGSVPADQGGTGFSSYTVGDLLYADTTSTLAKLNDVATGNALVSGGAGVAPSWGKIVLGTHTTGNYVSSITGTANQIDASSSTGNVTLSIPNDFRVPGTIRLNGITYTFPTTQSSNFILATDGSGTLSWADPSVVSAGSNYWNLTSGLLFPKNSSSDTLFGGDSTQSAKFAFINTISGTPTASIAGTVSNTATYLTGNGNLATTNMNHLTLGGSTTGQVDVNNDLNLASGKSLLVNGTGRIDTNGNFTANNLTVNGNVASNLVPSTNNTYDLGSVSNKWANVYAVNLNQNGNTVCDTSGNCANYGPWAQGLGVVYTNNNSSDVLIGSNSTDSAKFAFTGVNSGTPTASVSGTYLTANGNLATTNMNHLTLGGSTTGQVDINNNLNLTSGNGFSINDTQVLSNTTLGSGVINSSLTQVGALNSGSIASGFGSITTTNGITGGSLTSTGTTTFGGITYNWPASQGTNYVLTTDGSGTLTWTDPSAAVGASIYWTQANGVLNPKNSSVDVLIGSTSSQSAKFAFTGVNSGTPTASISGTYLTSTGNLSNTSMNGLTLGSATTGNVVINSRGQASLTANGANLTTVGTFSLPNNNTIVGQPNFAQFSRGVSVGGSTTYNFDSAGDINNNNLTVNGTTNFIGSIGSNILPTTNNTFNLGSSSFKWANVYATAFTQNGNTVCDSSDNCLVNGPWVQNAGVLNPKNNSVDVLIGSNSTGSAKFAFTGVNSGTPTASVSGTYLTSAGNLATTNMQHLTLGGSTTGQVNVANNLNLTTGNGFLINNSSVLNATTLGSSVVNSSLTQVGALNSGSIASGFGSITTTNGITGGSLTSTGTTTFGGITYNWPASQSTNYVLSTNGSGTLSWVDPSLAVASTIYWTQANGALNPKNSSVDVLIGGDSTQSAKFAFINTLTGTPTASVSGTYLTANGNLATTNMNQLTLGGSTTGQVNSANNFNLTAGNSYLINGTSVLNNNTLGSGVTNSSLTQVGALSSGSIASGFGSITTTNGITGGSLTSTGTTTFGGITYNWPASQGSSYILQTDGAGTLSWIDANSAVTNYWNQANGTLFAKNNTVDLLLGASSTQSAKFAFTGVNSGTPTASVSGTYLTANGNLATTNMNHLTLGGSTTGQVDVANSLSISGNLRATGTTTFNNLAYTWPASQNTSYILQTDGAGTLSWVDPNTVSASTIYWTQANGVLNPKNNSVDVLIGSNSTSSAKFAFTGVNSGTPTASVSGTYLTSAGNLATTNMQHLTLGGSTTGQINVSNDLNLSSGKSVLINNASVLNSTTLGSSVVNSSLTQVGALNSGSIASGFGSITTTNGITGGTLTSSGSTTFGGITYTWPGTQTAGYILQNNGTGTLSWVDPNTVSASTIYWNQANGILYPKNNTVDVLIGSTSSESAKFAFTGVNSGTPTASVSGTYLTANGNLANTSMRDLTLGGSTTGQVIINSRGNSALIANGLNLTAGGTITLPSANIITGLPNFVQFDNGISIGGSTTYYFDSAGNINANAGTFAGNVAVNGASLTTTSTGTASLFNANATTLHIGGASTAVTLGTTNVALTLGGNSTIYGGNNSNGTLTLSSTSNGTKGNIQFFTSSNTIDENGNLTLAGNATINGNTTLGNATSDTISLNGRVNTNIIPNVTATNDLGSITLAFNNIYGTSIYQNGNLVCDSAGTNCPVQFNLWNQANGLIYPNNNSVDFLVGGNSTSSSKFAITGVNTNSPVATLSGTYLTNAGNLGTTNMQHLTLGGSTTGQVDVANNLSITGNLVATGTTTLNGITYTWPSTQNSSYILQTNGTGTLSWVDPSTVSAASIYWNQANGILYPKNNSVDVLIGSNSTGSAKFAFTGVNSGTPTASVSGTYLTANGNLATTNMQHLTLGGSTTGQVDVSNDLNLASGKSVLINNASVLNSTTLGGSVINSSLTSVGNLTGLTNNGNTTLGDATSDTITFNGRVNSTVNPSTNNSFDLGSTGLNWANVYATAFTQNGNLVCDSSGANCPSTFNLWNQTNGAIYPNNNSVDFLVGANSTSSSKFAITGVNTNSPVATLSGTYLTNAGNLATTNMQHLTLGGSTTGQVDVSNDLNLASGKSILINNASVLNSTTLGSSVINSSLTSVGTLTSGTWNASLIGPTFGGTGINTYTTGDLLYASATNTLSKLADVATGNVLISGGVSTAPSWGKVTLGTHTTGNYVSTITGTANQITASASTGDITLSLPSSLITPNDLTVSGNTQIGNAITDTIDFQGRVLQDSDLIPVTATGANDLGSTSLPWDNLYVTTITQNGNLVCDASGANCPASSTYWDQANGTIYATNNSVDFLIGGNSSASAKFAITSVNTSSPIATISGTYLTSAGNLATTKMQHLTLGGSTTGQVDVSNDLNLASGKSLLINNTSVLNSTTLGSSVVNSSLTSLGNLTGLTNNGNTTLGDATSDTITFNGRVNSNIVPSVTATNDLGSSSLKWNNVYAVSFNQNGNTVCDSSGNCPGSTNYWGQANGALYALNNSVDLLLGSTATTSAKFAFTGVNSGTPTASISGTTTNVATYLDGNGNLGVTNRANLSLGNSSARNTTGNILLNSNGVGNVGIGTTTPTYPLDISSTTADKLVNITSTQTNANGVYGVFSDITNADPGVDGQSFGAYFHTTQTGGDNLYGLYAQADGTGIGGNSIGLYGVATGSNSTGLYAQGNSIGGNFFSLGTGAYISSLGNIGLDSNVSNASTTAGDTDGILNQVSRNSNVTTGTDSTTGVFTNVTRTGATGGNISTTGNYISLATDNAGSGTSTAYGQIVTLDGNSDFNYSGIYVGGNFGIGTWTPSSLLSVGSASQFQVNSSGIISSIDGVAHTIDDVGGNLTLTSNSNTVSIADGLSITGDTVLGDAITDNITFTGRVAQDSDLIPITTTGTNDLGSASLPWDNIYGVALSQNGNTVCDSSLNCADKYWQLNTLALSPANSTYDLVIGGTATASAKFQAFALEKASDTTSRLAKLNSSVLTTGTVFEATASAITSGNIIKLGTGGNNGNFTGNGLLMDFDNTGGSSFTGNFLKLDKAGANVLTINSSGDITTVGDLTLTPAGGQLYLTDTDTLNVGGITNVAYNAFANSSDSPTATNITADNDLFVGGDLELKGGLYLTGRNIFNVVGGVSTGAIALATDPTAVNSFNVLGYGSWFVQNNTNNGIAALMVDQVKGGDLFTASASGATKFTIDRTGNITNAGTSANFTFSGSGTHAISNSSAGTNLTIDAGTSGLVQIGNTSTGNIELAGGSGSTGCTIANTTGNLTCSGDISTTATSGTQGWLQLANKVLSPANSTYDLAVGANATASAKFQAFGTESLAGDILKLNSSVITTGNIFEATSSAITSGNIIKLGQGGNASFTGNGILMDFDNTGGGTFSGNYVSFKNNTTQVFAVDSNGKLVDQFVTAGIALGATNETALTGFGSTSIVGALNELKNTNKNISHNDYEDWADHYIAKNEGTLTNPNETAKGLFFDTFSDSTKIDSVNSTSSGNIQVGDNEFRVGLTGGQTYNSATNDNDSHAYLGGNSVTDINYYDRTRDSSPQTMVDMGFDPNWYNGVTLSVATTSATYSLLGQYNPNPHLTTSYNGSLIKVTGTDSTPRSIYITVKTPTTFDWTNYQGDSATGVTMTFGTAQTLGATGVSVTFTEANYNVGDVFKISSWFIEPAGSTRGSKQQFPERANIIATTTDVNIIDADTQKLWMRLSGNGSGNQSFVLFSNVATITSVKMLNGKLYVGSGGTTGDLRIVNFLNDTGNVYNASTGFYYLNEPIAGRATSTMQAVLIDSSKKLTSAIVNDVDAVVIPNSPRHEETVQGWGYIQHDGVSVTIQETVTMPYVFTSIKNVTGNSIGLASSRPTSISDCASSGGINVDIGNIGLTQFIVSIRHNNDTTALSSSFYSCYSWTATGIVSPKQFVAAATGSSSTDGGISVINEVQMSKSDLLVGSQLAGSQFASKVAFAGNDLYPAVYGDGTYFLEPYYGIAGVPTETTWAQYRSGVYDVAQQTDTWSPNGIVIRGSATTDPITSLYATENTSNRKTGSNTIYVGTSVGVSVIQEVQSGSSSSISSDGFEERLGSVKYYTKDFISEDLAGDIRGMWPLDIDGNFGATFSGTIAKGAFTSDVSIKNGDVQVGGSALTLSSGVRNSGLTFSGSNYLSCTDANCGGTTKLDPSTGQWTIGAWVKTAKVPRQIIVGKGTASGQFAYGLEFQNGGSPSFSLYNTVDTNYIVASSSARYNDNQWHHLVGVYDGTTAYLYVDGLLNATSTTKTGTQVTDSTSDFEIGTRSTSPALGFIGQIDEPFVTASSIGQNYIKLLYQNGYRALQSHSTSLGSTTADTQQRLGFISTGTNSVGSIGVDWNNQYMYVGLNSTTLGGLSKIQLNNDTNVKTFTSSTNVPTGGTNIVDEDVNSLGVGYQLESVGSAASGAKSMAPDNNANSLVGSLFSKTQSLASATKFAYLWTNFVTDSSDATSAINVYACNSQSTQALCTSNNAWVLGTIIQTDSTQNTPEREYSFAFPTAGSNLTFKFDFKRGSTKTNTFIERYGSTWASSVGGADIAERYHSSEPTYPGDILTIDTPPENGDAGVKLARTAYDQKLIGIVTTNPGIVMDDNLVDLNFNAASRNSPNRPAVALAGRVPVKVSTKNGAILVGDPITSSDIAGVGMKATKAGNIVGKALESLSCEEGVTVCEGKVMVLVNVSWYDPDVFLTSTGDLRIVGQKDPTNSTSSANFAYKIIRVTTDGVNEVVDRIGTFGEVVVGNIKAGAVTSEDFVTQNLVAKAFKVDMITPIDGSGDINIMIGSTATPSGKLAIKNALNEEVASIDNLGNASFAGIVRSQNIDEITALLSQIQTDQGLLSQISETASPSAVQNLSSLTANDVYFTNQITGLDFSITGNSINSLATPLKIQSLGLANIELMAGLITVDTSGNVNIAGNLNVAGKITTPVAEIKDITVDNFTIANTIEATDSAEIVSGVITSNATAGKAIIPAGTTEITIKNNKVNDYTLVYATPTSSTNNNVLYIKSKENGKFVIGFTNSLETDVNFNWWIVQIKQ